MGGFKATANAAETGADVLTAIVKNGDEVIEGAGDVAKVADNVVDAGKIKDFKGIDVQQNNSLFDPSFVDSKGRTNIERMNKGLAPVGVDGKSVNLHHVDQTMDGGVMEITTTRHQQEYGSLHKNTGQEASQINRPEFDGWRNDYWKSRANDFE